MSQRFCLRWNNHQSNMLSVFDQLLHDESFVDVTLAVDGHLLKAHKMVLSACSPLFQALFIGHPDKHPIVILKDVPYADMRCLLDFMYRGEVSVDQDRLTAFLKVAESLRIKGLTEVNEEKCDIPSITNNLLSSLPNAQTPPPPPPPPPHLQRLPHGSSGQKRSLPPLVASNPLLGSALTAPKRKRGRPRKLSGSSNGDPSHTRDSSPHDHEQDDALDLEFDSRLGHGSSGESIHSSPPPPELMEMHMDYGQPPVKLGKNMSSSPAFKESKGTPRKKAKDENEPTPGTSSDGQFRLSGSNSHSNSLSSPSGNGGLHNSSGSIGGSSLLNTDSYSSGLGESHLSSVAITPAVAQSLPARLPSGLPPAGLLSLALPKRDNYEWEDEKYADFITNSPLREDERSPKVHEATPVLMLPKKEMFDKRKLTRPRKLTDRPTINNEADFNANQETERSADRSAERSEYDCFEALSDRPELASTPTSDVEQRDGRENREAREVREARDGNGNSIVQENKSVREFCSREDGNLFRCKVCQRTYTHISNFCRHFITTHRGVKQEIPCLICGKMFTRKDNMVTHMKMVHNANRNDRPPVPATTSSVVP